MVAVKKFWCPFCSFLFLFVPFCSFPLFFSSISVLFQFARHWPAGRAQLSGVTHASGIITEALEKEKPTVGKMVVFLGILLQGRISRRAP
jgi:hypothetical protein